MILFDYTRVTACCVYMAVLCAHFGFYFAKVFCFFFSISIKITFLNDFVEKPRTKTTHFFLLLLLLNRCEFPFGARKLKISLFGKCVNLQQLISPRNHIDVLSRTHASNGMKRKKKPFFVGGTMKRIQCLLIYSWNSWKIYRKLLLLAINGEEKNKIENVDNQSHDTF